MRSISVRLAVGLVCTIGLAGGLYFGCTDRTSRSTDERTERAAALCSQRCTMTEACGVDPLPESELAACVESCLERYFKEPVCEPVAEEMLLSCNAAYMKQCDSNDDTCATAKTRWNSCRGNPEYWSEHECHEKCPGECCVNADFPD